MRVPDATGKRRCVGTYADEAEARATLRAALERLAARDISAVGVVTLRAWGETWLASRDARGLDKERSVWTRHVLPHLGDHALHEVTRVRVAAWLGHSSTAVTQRYAHLAPDHLSARVAAALAPPSAAPASPSEGSSGGTGATGSIERKPLRDKGRAMQESNLRPSASETEARRANPSGKPVSHAPPVPRQSHGAAVEVLILAARGDTLPAALLTDLARGAIVAGVRGDMALALLDGAGEHAARIAVDLAAAVCGAQTRARETGT